MIHLNVVLLQIGVGLVIPFITGLVARERSDTIKVVVNTLLAAIGASLVFAISNNGNVDLQYWLLGIALTWVSSIAFYHGAWKPTQLVDDFVVLAVKLLAKIGIHLKPPTVLTTEEWLEGLFGDALTWITEEEADWILRRANAVPDPGTVIPGPTHLKPEKEAEHGKQNSGPAVDQTL